MMLNIDFYLVIQILKYYVIEMILWNNIHIKEIVLINFKNLMNFYIIKKDKIYLKNIMKNFLIFHLLLNI